uniref:Lectin/glucanase superfamily protein n=1 Tax=viral metagenome TaxID=1070528 RepID=A0A6C0DQ28_9ZZZZ
MNSNSQRRGFSVTQGIVAAIVLLLIIAASYYLYKFLFGVNQIKMSATILGPVTSAVNTHIDLVTGVDAVQIVDISGVVDNGQYSSSFWLYVNNTADFTGSPTPLVHLFEISNGKTSAGKIAGSSGSCDTNGMESRLRTILQLAADTEGFVAGSSGGFTAGTAPAATLGINRSTVNKNVLLFVGMNPRDGSLIVRQNTNDGYNITNDTSMATNSMTEYNYSLPGLINNYNSPQSVFQRDDRCDILNGIEYQRWVHVTVVGNQRTLDIYVDGKLARSCVYSSYFSSGSKDAIAQAFVGAGNGGKFKGYFSNVMYYNYAMSPEEIWAMYQAGPGSPFTLSQFFKNLFSVNLTFKG